MGANTGIEWTDATWNPVRGCSRVSAGCENCYAETLAGRFSGRGLPYEGLVRPTPTGWRWTGKIDLVHKKLEEPMRWRKPRRVFVNSMSDLFHEGVPDMYLAAVFAVMESTPQHTYQILTKRPKRMARLLTRGFYAGLVRKAGYDILGGSLYRSRNPGWPIPNVWIGVSAENQAAADERIPLLLQTPAAVRFVSYEPALGPVDFGRWMAPKDGPCDAHQGFNCGICRPRDDNGRPSLSWIIAGSESGPGARPAQLDWYRQVRDQCEAAGVPFFLKQLSERGKKISLPVLDGRQWLEVPAA